MPFPGVAKGKQLSSPTRQARVPGALQWWRLQEARGPSPGCTGLPQDLPRSQQLWQLCLPSAGPPPGLQPHLPVLTQPGSNTGPCLFLSASSTAVDEDLGDGGAPSPQFLGFLSGGPRGHPARMVRKNGHSPGGRQVAWPSGTRRPGFLSSRARTRVPSCGVCLPLALAGVVVS